LDAHWARGLVGLGGERQQGQQTDNRTNHRVASPTMEAF
jgi:hypothetical protein